MKAVYIDTAVTNIIPSCDLTESISLIPNPAKNQFVLQATMTQAIDQFTIRIVNTEGQTVSMIKKTKPAGLNNFTIPIHYLSSGKYYVSVYDGSHLLATKPLVKL